MCGEVQVVTVPPVQGRAPASLRCGCGSGRERAGLVWVASVKVADVCVALEFVGWFPCKAIFAGVAAPFNEVAESAGVSAVDFAVDDAFDFVLEVAINLDGRRWRLSAIRKCVGLVWLEEADVEDVVDPHGSGELEPVGV